MTNLPLVSVIMPNYNHAKYLKQSISTFINQTYPNKELIIVDDSSTDNSLDVISRLIHLQDNITLLLNQRNMGPNISWNRGALCAKGEYLCNLDADDTLPITSLETRISSITQLNIPAVHTGLTLIHPNQTNTYLDPLVLTNHHIINFLKTSPDSRCVGINSCTTMFRRELVSEIGLKDEMQYRSHADYEYTLRMLLYLGTISTIQFATYNYHLRIGSLNARMSQDIQAKKLFSTLEESYLSKFLANESQ